MGKRSMQRLSVMRRWLGPTALTLAPHVACGGLASHETGTHNGGSASAESGAVVMQAVGDAGSTADAQSGAQQASVSKCGPTPTQLVDFKALAAQVGPDRDEARALAVDGANVYFLFAGNLMRVPIRGGPASPVFSLQLDAGQPLATDESGDAPIITPTTILLHNSANVVEQTILAVPIQGGNATTLATSNGFVSSFVADENNVYFSDSTGVKSVPIAGGDVQVLTDGGSTELPGLAVVGSNLIVAAPPGLFSIPAAGGPQTVLAIGDPQFPFPCNSDICWVNYSPIPMSGDSNFDIMRLSDAGVTTLALGPMGTWAGTFLSIAFDGSDFLATVGCGGEIPRPGPCSVPMLRIPASGAPPVQLLPALFLTLDDDCIYFSVAGAGTSMPYYGGGILSDGIYSVDKSYTPN
jgi:hypothetical protein